MNTLVSMLRRTALLLASTALLAGCGGGGDSPAGDAAPSSGTLQLALTDNPSCGYDNVFITIEKVRVHQSATADDSTAGWQEIVLNPAQRLDLLPLTNGNSVPLGEVTVPAGSYTQMRLVLARNGGAPFANAVKPTGGAEVDLKTPSAEQSGLKAKVNMTVPADRVASFMIDFDACKSVVKAGNSGHYILKPVITVTPVLSDAGQRIVGYIDTATLDTTTPGAETTVSAQVAAGTTAGTVVKATPPDATGKFVLYPVPPGTYSLVVASTNRATAVMTAVPVTTTAHTNIGAAAGPRIALVAATTNEAKGVVTLNASTAGTGASVRAMQQPFNGPLVEVAARPVDADTGAYSFALPVASPQLTSHAAYAANPTAILFSADSASAADTAAGEYTLEAGIDGLLPKTGQISLDAGAVTTDFAFTAP